jgi:hypothetical protein
MAAAQVADAMNRYDLPRNECNPRMALGALERMHGLMPQLKRQAAFIAATSEASFRLAVSSDVEFALLPMLPLPVADFDPAMTWNQQAENDPGVRWLRSRCMMFLGA